MHAPEFSANWQDQMTGRGGDAGERGTGAPERQRGWVLGSPTSRRPGGAQPPEADRSVPPGVDAADLAEYSLMLGDDALLMAHRLSEWGVRAPGLAESAALLGACLELLEQARSLLFRSGELSATGMDQLAYRRVSAEFRNVRLAEIDCGPGPGGDFAMTVARLLLFATWRRAVFERLAGTSDPVLSALARRSAPNLREEQEHAARWVIELGADGRGPRRRVLSALHRVWPLAGELFTAHPVEIRLAAAGAAVDPGSVRADVAGEIGRVMSEAGLRLPDLGEVWSTGSGGRYGVHTESMPFVLAELQHLVRADPVDIDPGA